jgi:K+-sensing histidine kinase KdpD
MDTAKKAGAVTEVLESEDRTAAIIAFARAKRITQIFVSHSPRKTWRERFFGDPVLRLIRQTEGIDIRVFPR